VSFRTDRLHVEIHTTAGCYRRRVFAYRVYISGGASAVKEPGHFEVRKSSSQLTRMHFFPQEKLTTFFQLPPSKYRPPTPFHRQNKTNKAVRYGNIFSSHYHRSKAIRRAMQGKARAMDLPARSFDLACPGVAPPLVYVFLIYYVYKASHCCMQTCGGIAGC